MRLTREGRAVPGSRRSAGTSGCESTLFGLRSVPVQTVGSRCTLPQFPTIGTTASVANSGLLDAILPPFRRHVPVAVRSHLVASGRVVSGSTPRSSEGPQTGCCYFTEVMVSFSAFVSSAREIPVISMTLSEATSETFAGGAAIGRVEPFNRSNTRPPAAARTRPRAVTLASLVSFPLLRIVRRSHGRVVVLSGFSRMSTVPFLRETSTVATPSTFFTAALTARAHDAQSRPVTTI